MPISEHSVRILVVVPKEYAQEIDRMIGPGRRSRSAVVRLLVEAALGRSFSLPVRSADRTDGACQEPADIAA